jgi:hypothetical protein
MIISLAEVELTFQHTISTVTFANPINKNASLNALDALRHATPCGGL